MPDDPARHGLGREAGVWREPALSKIVEGDLVGGAIPEAESEQKPRGSVSLVSHRSSGRYGQAIVVFFGGWSWRELSILLLLRRGHCWLHDETMQRMARM